LNSRQSNSYTIFDAVIFIRYLSQLGVTHKDLIRGAKETCLQK